MPNKTSGKVWTIIGLLIFVAVFYFLSKEENLITNILKDSGPWAPVVAIILYPLLALSPITTDPITVVVGVAYGPLIGTLIAWVGNVLAMLLEYYFGVRLSKTINFEKEKDKMPFGLAKLPVNSVAFLILGRAIPGYGSKIISILAAAYKVPIKRYLWTSMLTSLLGSILLSYGGFGIIRAIR
jgi:uncharacterized membrane protein YdjX (TVP38/TMEM64 family)